MKAQALKPFSKTTRILVATILIAFVFVAVYIYMFFALKKSSEKTAALEIQTASLIAQESQVGQFRKNLTATEEQRQKLSSYFIDAKDIVPFLETIEGYGTDTGIEVTFSSVDIKKTPSRLDVGIFAEGDFDDLYRFLALLEAAPYEITFTEVDVHSNVIEGLIPTGTQPYSAAWSAAITLSVLSISGVQ